MESLPSAGIDVSARKDMESFLPVENGGSAREGLWEAFRRLKMACLPVKIRQREILQEE